MRSRPFLLLSLAACAGRGRPAPQPPRIPATGVALATFEIRDDALDRFEHCPPPGEIGQEWLPPIPEWHAPAASATAGLGSSERAPDVGAGVTDAMASMGLADPGSPASQTELTEEAAAATHAAFRRCYHWGLRWDPTQDGHVAVVLRVDPTGRVDAVETWGACDLSSEALVCMRDEAARVRLHPPAAGSATVTVPAVFTSGAERARPRNSAYAAAAYVAVETTRPRLHACLHAAKRSGEAPFADATMVIEVDAEGRGRHVGVDD